MSDHTPRPKWTIYKGRRSGLWFLLDPDRAVYGRFKSHSAALNELTDQLAEKVAAPLAATGKFTVRQLSDGVLMHNPGGAAAFVHNDHLTGVAEYLTRLAEIRQ